MSAWRAITARITGNLRTAGCPRRSGSCLGRSPVVRKVPFGLTDEVPALMAAADLITCEAGTTTCGETRVVGRPLLLPDVVPECGRTDLLHELERGNAGSCGPRDQDISAGALALLDVGTRCDTDRDTLHWALAYRDALALIGLDVAAGC